MQPIVRLRQAAHWDSLMAEIFLPSTLTSPLVGLSIPAIRFNSVDLPEPDGPIKQRNPPDSRSRLVLCNATTSVASRLKTFLTLRISTAAMTISSPPPDLPSSASRDR